MNVDFSPKTVSINVSSPSLGIGIGNPIARDVVEHDPYTGDYTVTPQAEAIALYTNDKRMTDNVTVNPIPNNYGLITWDGSVLTIS